ncbi:FMN reductase [Sanguibacter sp. HDW7]|uniref:FMN reductase n=1 Tax=Sanguibacter sp. HDW7 TaxID=2714931 RepID=UPI001408270A|nr:FMN reductase [Sanguibacter sp. HDW7]QIK83501.1 FMN reductase [Sanguibacter sp. HDW7]
MTRRLVAVSGGLSQPSSTRLLADRLVTAAADELVARGQQVETETVELRDLAHDITDMMLTGFPSPRLGDVLERVRTADGLVLVSPIFSGSYSGLFKSFFDVVDPKALTDVPVLLGATAGTPRHSLALEHALRPLFSYLHADVVGTAVFAATDDWGATGSAYDTAGKLQARIDKAGRELGAKVAAYAGAQDDDIFADVVPFAEQLGR